MKSKTQVNMLHHCWGFFFWFLCFWQFVITKAELGFLICSFSNSCTFECVCLCAQWFPQSLSLPGLQTATLGSAPLLRWLQMDWPVKPKKQASAVDTWSFSGMKTSPCEDTPQITYTHGHKCLYSQFSYLKMIQTLIRAFKFPACAKSCFDCICVMIEGSFVESPKYHNIS